MKTLLASLLLFTSLCAHAAEEGSPCAEAAVSAALKQARFDAADPEESPVSAHVVQELSANRLYWVAVEGGLDYDVATALNSAAQECVATHVELHHGQE